ncbi:MAG: PD-(D/E)XK nuclease family protein [Armatimonadetes bacterium]|nr:PD-(D/E)XK nuclease family protein [Armatimonadota bacterium]
MIRGFRCPLGRGDLLFDECLECAASHENPCQFDYPILTAMQRNIREEAGISVSSLLNCLRKVALEARNDIYLDPSQLYYAFRGQLFHAVIAQAQDGGAVCEEKFERAVAGIVLSGHPDVIYPQHRKLVDYKSTKRIPKDDKPYANHAMQVNLYRYLVAPRYPVDHLEIVYFDMSEVKRVPVKVMSVRQVLGWLVPRLKVLKSALDGGKLPPKAGSEGIWQCNGYCHFTSLCWPGGAPSAPLLKKKEEAKTEVILKRMGRRPK